MKLFWDNAVDAGTVAASSENANYPAANLQKPQLSSRWRTADGVKAATVTVDAPARTETEVFFEACTQLVTNAENLTVAGGWTLNNATAILGSYAGHPVTKITATAANGESARAVVFTGDGIKAIQGLIVAGTDTISRWIIYDDTAAANRLYLTVTWATHSIALTSGTLLRAVWITDAMVYIEAQTTAITAANNHRIIARVPTNGMYSYFTKPQVENATYPSPYIDPVQYPTLIRAAHGKTATVTMPQRFCFKIKTRPWFLYTSATNHQFAGWYIGANNKFRVAWLPNPNFKIYIYWKDGGTARYMYSQQFDDGTAFDDINAEIILFGAVRLTAQTGQRFFAIVDGVKQTESTQFDGAPDAKSSSFTSLRVGHENSTNYADSGIHSVELYNWDGVDPGALATEADIDAYLESQGRPFYEFDPTPRLEADSLALREHNLTGASLVTLDAWDDYAEGLLNYFSQSGYVKADPYLMEFGAAKSYQHWRLALDDPNVLIGGAAADTYLEAGRLALFKAYVSEPLARGLVHRLTDSSLSSVTPTKQRYVDEGPQLNIYEVSLGMLAEAKRQELLEIFAAVGRHEPVIIIPDENHPEILPALYAYLEADVAFTGAGGWLWRDEVLKFVEAL